MYTECSESRRELNNNNWIEQNFGNEKIKLNNFNGKMKPNSKIEKNSTKKMKERTTTITTTKNLRGK